jgi:predicted RecA/RadA family phage recombinase
MAKECELLGKSYEEIRVAPAAAVVAGEVEKYNEVNGFYLTEVTAAMVAAGETAALITKADRVKVIKNTGEVWAPGEAIYWDDGNSWFSNVAGALDLCGYAAEDVAATVLEAVVNFDGFAAFLKA